VIEAADASSIYQVPLLMKEQHLDEICLKKLNITWFPEPDLTAWKEFLTKLENPKSTVHIGLIGKYIELQDAYKSILEAFIHAGAMNQVKVIVQDVHSESISKENIAEKLGGLDGLLVAPGFGHRGIDGHFLEYAWACKCQSSNLQEMWLVLPMHIQPKWIQIHQTL
jgi:CTP synthase